MAEKINEFANKFGKGGGRMPGAPKGLGLGIKLLAAGAASVYGISQSMYTGIMCVRLNYKLPRIK